MNVTWTPLTAQEITDTGATGYEIYYIDSVTLDSKPLTKDTADATKVDVAGATTAIKEIAGLTGGTEYTFVIYAVNGSTYSQVSTEVTGTPVDQADE